MGVSQKLAMDKNILQAVEDLIIDKDDVWIISDGWKYLFKYNISKQRLETVVAFPKTIGTDYNAFSQIIKVENEIYFIPLTARDIYFCNLLEKEMYKIDVSFLPLPEVKNMSAIVSGKSIYCINRFPDMIIKIDTVTKKIEVFDADISQYLDEDSERLVYRSYKKPCVDHEIIYWINCSNMLIKFDIKASCFSVQYIEGLPRDIIEPIETEGFKLRDWIIGVKIFEGVMFLFSMKGKIYKYDGRALGMKEELFDNYCKFSSMDRIMIPVFYDLIPVNHSLYFIPSYKNDCIKYDSITKQFSKTLYSYTNEWEGNQRSYTFWKVINGKQILLYNFIESCFYLLDIEKNFIERKFLKLPIIGKELVKENFAFAERIVSYMGINDNINILIGRLFNSSDSDDKRAKNHMDIGEKIYDSTI